MVIWLFNVTINDISVIYVTAHRCAGGLKKKFLGGRSVVKRFCIEKFDNTTYMMTDLELRNKTLSQ